SEIIVSQARQLAIAMSTKPRFTLPPLVCPTPRSAARAALRDEMRGPRPLHLVVLQRCHCHSTWPGARSPKCGPVRVTKPEPVDVVWWPGRGARGLLAVGEGCRRRATPERTAPSP